MDLIEHKVSLHASMFGHRFLLDYDIIYSVTIRLKSTFPALSDPKGKTSLYSKDLKVKKKKKREIRTK